MVRGTVILPLALACPVLAQEEDTLDARVEAALDDARPALVHHLRREEASRLALVSLAAAHDGMTMEDSAFAKAAESLVAATITDTYGLSLRLMVAARVPNLPDREQTAHRDTVRLLTNQANSGGFSYRAEPTHWDLSNTQYAALGLRAAAYLGEEIPEDAWERLGRAMLEHQRVDGGFGYSGGGTSTVSMTVAGIAVVEICRRQLQLTDQRDRTYGRSVERGWRWLRNRRTRVFDLNRWHALYAFYGVERAAVLSGVDEIGNLDWFEAGAEALLGLQQRRGGFVNPHNHGKGRKLPSIGDPLDTAFAVLFLRRSFQRDLGPPRGPITPGPSRGCRELPDDADDARVRAAVAYEVARGHSAVPDLLVAMRVGHEPARRAAGLAFLRITGEDFGYHPARSTEQNARALRSAERWWIANRTR